MLRLAQRSQRVVRQNLALSILVISVLVVGALAGRLTCRSRCWGTNSAGLCHRQRPANVAHVACIYSGFVSERLCLEAVDGE